MFLRLLAVLLLVCMLAHEVVPRATSTISPLRPRTVQLAATVLLQNQFGGLLTKLEKAEGSLKKAYEKDDTQSVVTTFTGIHNSFQTLANSSSKTYNRNRESPSYFASDFIEALIELQSLLTELKAHPKALEECIYTFRGTSVSINAIISFLKAGHVDLKSEAEKYGKELDWNLFYDCGFRLNSF